MECCLRSHQAQDRPGVHMYMHAMYHDLPAAVLPVEFRFNFFLCWVAKTQVSH